MPRRKIHFLPGSYYHVYNRGHNRQPIFFERGNYLYFLRQFRHYMDVHIPQSITTQLRRRNIDMLTAQEDDTYSERSLHRTAPPPLLGSSMIDLSIRARRCQLLSKIG